MRDSDRLATLLDFCTNNRKRVNWRYFALQAAMQETDLRDTGCGGRRLVPCVGVRPGPGGRAVRRVQGRGLAAPGQVAV